MEGLTPTQELFEQRRKVKMLKWEMEEHRIKQSALDEELLRLGGVIKLLRSRQRSLIAEREANLEQYFTLIDKLPW